MSSNWLKQGSSLSLQLSSMDIAVWSGKTYYSSISDKIVKRGTGSSSECATGLTADSRFWVLPSFLLVFVKTFHIIKAGVIIIKMIYWFSPNHWYSKLKFAVCTITKSFNTSFANIMWCPSLALNTKFHVKLCFLCPCHKICDVLFCFPPLTLHICSKMILMEFTASQRRNDFVIKYSYLIEFIFA